MAQMQADPAIPAALPSAAQIVKATAIAFAVALGLVVVAVLPVEYGVDITGAGKTLGLLRASEEKEAVPVEKGDASLQPVVQGPAALYNTPYRTNTATFVLGPYEYVEYKYHLVKGAGMVFSWKADGVLTHDFHGELDGNPKDVRSYDKSRKSGSSGSLVAPMTGIHGWFWENPGNKPIAITVTSSGFYAYAMEFRSDKTRKRHDVQTVTFQKP